VEPERDFAERNAGAAIMLARGGDDGGLGAFAQNELKANFKEI
jgi:hypothetical protein